jgi:glc operon protein GlcG
LSLVLSPDGLARKPSLLILRQLAYLAGGWRVQSSPTTNFRPDDDARAAWEIDMRSAALMTLATLACLWLGVGAQAQQPSPAERPVALPASPPPEYGMPVNNEQAKAVAEAAIAEAKKNNWHMAIAIVGPEGELIYFEKMDGTQSSSVALAQAKARTSALFRRPSKAFADQFAAGNTGFMTFPDGARPIASEGGIPIVLNSKLVGAIGVSGGTAQQDTVAANAGVNAVKP